MKKRMLCLCMAVCLFLGTFVLPADTRAASSMTASEELLAMIKQFEGFSGTPYVDTDGLYTIGYGTRCPEELVDQYNETPMTEEEADAELRKAVATYAADVNAFIDKHGLSYEQRQFDAVISLVYNIGSGWLKKGDTLVDALTGGATGNELIYAFTIYSMSNGIRSLGHIRRRLSEACIYLEGIYSRPAPERYCHVLYDAQGGTISAMGGTYNVQGYNGELTAAPVATASRSGYVFKGWFTKASGGTQVTVLDMSTKGMTLYAHWEEEGSAVPTEPAPTDPAPTEPAPTEPAPTEPSVPEGTAIDPVTVRITGSQINIRKGPGLSYATVGSLNRGAQVTVERTYTSDGYTWGKCAKGWIALENTDYFTIGTEAPADPTEPEVPTDPPTEPATKPTEPVTKPTEPKPTEPEEPEAPIPEGTAIEPVKVTVEGIQVNLRKGPGLSFQVIGSASRGTVLTITATHQNDGYLWGKFEKGWICLAHTSYEEVPDDPEAPDQPADPSEPEAPADPTMPGPGNKLYATVIKTKCLNVRKTPNGAVMDMLYEGDRVEILEQKYVDGVLWGRCDRGWISMRTYVMLETVAEAPVEEPTQPSLPEEPEVEAPTLSSPVTKVYATVVGTTSQAVRQQIGGEVIGKLAPGDRVELLEQADGWGRCAQGWIRILASVKLEQVLAEEDVTAQESVATVVKTYATVDSATEGQVLSAPGGEVVHTMASGEQAEILEYSLVEDALWGRCESGWIDLKDGVKLETAASAAVAEDPQASFDAVTVRASCLNIRSEAGAGNPVVCRLYSGATVVIRELKPTGASIWARTDMGWINMDNIA